MIVGISGSVEQAKFDLPLFIYDLAHNQSFAMD
jgi:hypothetical protein